MSVDRSYLFPVALLSVSDERGAGLAIWPPELGLLIFYVTAVRSCGDREKCRRHQGVNDRYDRASYCSNISPRRMKACEIALTKNTTSIMMGADTCAGRCLRCRTAQAAGAIRTMTKPATNRPGQPAKTAQPAPYADLRALVAPLRYCDAVAKLSCRRSGSIAASTKTTWSRLRLDIIR